MFDTFNETDDEAGMAQFREEERKNYVKNLQMIRKIAKSEVEAEDFKRS